ncbi:alpha-(1,3)-fucosyltransferase C [Helicoverpa armigera]|uniref:alpha-(1,3)-fucosyltransferase C n=1 Tax=Helicoverpa armigera TaxID=29058 RepID=UPI0030829936
MSFLWKLQYNFLSLKCALSVLLFLIIFTLLQIWTDRSMLHYSHIIPSLQMLSDSGPIQPNISMKHILIWDKYYLMTTNRGNQIFPRLQCRVNNCLFTENKDLFNGDYTKFDAVLFAEQVLGQGFKLPEKRAQSQIYIFTTIESAYHVPACEVYHDDFFNWTFTYRLDSDVLWPHFLVRNAKRDVVAPSIDVKWKQYTRKRINSNILKILHKKTKAAAWLVSNCKADSARDDYLTRLQENLYHFSLQIDVYGECSKVKCANDNCGEMLAKDYYFYMAFENSFSEDYVTEKVLDGYHHYVVPIVYGGANYTRFLPPGSYLNAREIHPYNLAYIMYQSIKRPMKYHQFFRWTNYYTLDNDIPGHHPLCNLCEALNSEKAKIPKTYKNFRFWWNGRNGMKWCLSRNFWNETSLMHIDIRDMFHMY